MKPPRHVSSLLINIEDIPINKAKGLAAELPKIAGIVESVVVAEEGVAYLKVDKQHLDQAALNACLLEARSDD